jgi:hypothetical protein
MFFKGKQSLHNFPYCITMIFAERGSQWSAAISSQAHSSDEFIGAHQRVNIIQFPNTPDTINLYEIIYKVIKFQLIMIASHTEASAQKSVMTLRILFFASITAAAYSI